uniref:Uncharacterized protein n=3 Tax=Ostreococcus sp. 'lucimarinus' TaxID=242159 RepID=A0A7R9T4C9_9CHLO|mmetsp:Transcript_645/g.2674  ORF Transcript_645/g.2674 Transcript_645/m.2674 type:complete len:326 (+) Transcript_645:92-1069(+)
MIMSTPGSGSMTRTHVLYSRSSRCRLCRTRPLSSVARASSRGVTFTNAESIIGCRMHSGGKYDIASLEFLVRLADEDAVWLHSSDVSEDLRRDYEISWWKTCREGGDAAQDHLAQGGEVLVLARDKQLRSGLHYACGRGDVAVVEAMISCGAEIDALDQDGYTPLHIAAGYLHEQVISVLMKSGADPSLEDNSGRSALTLVETLLQNTPATTSLFSKRLAMEAVSSTLRSYMFEEIVPLSIIQKRPVASRDQFLVSWFDGFEPIWVDDVDVADDLINEFNLGIERASASELITIEGSVRAYPDTVLVKWSDHDLLNWRNVGTLGA